MTTSTISLSSTTATRAPLVVQSIKPATIAKFTRSSSLADIKRSGASAVTLGNGNTVYLGSEQVTATNINPIAACFNSKGTRLWVRRDYEVTGADSKGYGLFSNGKALYAVFSIDGTQGTPSQDYRRASAVDIKPWMRTYGAGGGAKVAVVGTIDPTTGALKTAAYLSSVLSTGKSNSLVVNSAGFNAVGNAVLKCSAYYAPRRLDGTPMLQVDTTLKSPFAYTIELTPDLKDAKSVAATGWQS